LKPIDVALDNAIDIRHHNRHQPVTEVDI